MLTRNREERLSRWLVKRMICPLAWLPKKKEETLLTTLWYFWTLNHWRKEVIKSTHAYQIKSLGGRGDSLILLDYPRLCTLILPASQRQKPHSSPHNSSFALHTAVLEVLPTSACYGGKGMGGCKPLADTLLLPVNARQFSPRIRETSQHLAQAQSNAGRLLCSRWSLEWDPWEEKVFLVWQNSQMKSCLSVCMLRVLWV